MLLFNTMCFSKAIMLSLYMWTDYVVVSDKDGMFIE
jgi:hypothetical protein